MEIKHRHSQTAQRVLDEVRALTVANPRVLEIGCEPGWFAERLAGSTRYLGLDPSSDAVDAIRRRLPHAGVEFAEFAQWDPKGRTFDVILLVDRLSSMRDQQEVIARTSSLLDAGGYLVVASENPRVCQGQNWVRPQGSGEFRHWPSRNELHNWLARVGLRIVKSYTVVPGGHRGLLRIINSHRLNRVLGLVLSERVIAKTKERAGLGQFRIIVARK